jgi:lipopolysaccharide export system protein LptC
MTTLEKTIPAQSAAQAAVARAVDPGLFDPLGFRARARRRSVVHSQIVSLLKLVLPAVAVALVALVLLWPQLGPMDQRFGLKSLSVGMDDLENLRMINPRYVGSDSQDQPYTVTADQATQASGKADVTDLARPKGDIALKSGRWLALSADNGRYYKSDRILDLEGGVNLSRDDGYEIVTSQARIDLAKNQAEGQQPVLGHGPDMEIQGQGFRIEQGGNRVVVTGPSRLVIHRAPAGT